MEPHTQHSSGERKRRPAPAGIPRRKPAASGAQHRRPPASGTRRPASDERRTAPRRPASAGRRPVQKKHNAGDMLLNMLPTNKERVQHTRPHNPQQRPPQNRRPADGRPRRPANARYPEQTRPRSSAAGARRPAGTASRGRRRIAPVTKGSLVMFAIIIVLYIIIASVFINGRRKKAAAYLAEYEASRPQYAIEDYVASLDETFFNNMVRQSAEAIPVSSYETTEGIMDSLQMKSASADAAVPYTYIQKEDYTESRPSYYIMRGDEAVASVQLGRSGWTDRFNFPIWRVNEPVSVLNVHAEPAYDISVTLPTGCILNVNGNPVPEELMTETDADITLNTMEQNYMPQPTARLCEMSGFYMPPTVEVKDREGNVLTPENTPDITKAHHEYVYRQAPDPAPDPALKERVEAMTRAYMDYVINKNKDRFNNIAVLNNYLMPGSEAAVLMQSIINDIYWNNEYDGRTDDVRVEGIRMYSEKLCTADVHFDTTLTKNGVGTNEYISTIRWTLVNNGWGWYATSFDLHMDQD